MTVCSVCMDQGTGWEGWGLLKSNLKAIVTCVINFVTNVDVEGDGGWASIVAASQTLLLSSLDECRISTIVGFLPLLASPTIADSARKKIGRRAEIRSPRLSSIKLKM